MNGGAAPAFVVALCVLVAYLQGPVSTDGALPLPIFAALNNVLGWSITMTALGVLALESVTAAASLLLGLFFYDAFFVFKSDVMVTVATQIEAPAKFLFPANVLPGDTRYPFSVLGLGDVVVPGAFVSILREFDTEQRRASLPAGRRGAKRGATSGGDEDSNAVGAYFRAGLGGYTFGLLGTFVANYVTKAGQPALVYIVPSLLIAAAATAATRSELDALLAFKSARAAAATEERDAWRAARAAQKDAAKP